MSGLFWPTSSMKISAGGEYGNDRGPGHSPRYHQGADISIGVGTPIYGSGDGTVTAVINTGATAGYGLYVKVRYVIGGLTVDVINSHMSREDVHVGQRVSVGTLLGVSGGTFHSFGAGDATGPHDHLELRANGVLQNPANYLNPRSSTAGSGGTPVGDGTAAPPPPQPTMEDEDMLYITSAGTGPNGYARNGNTYRLVDGSWIGVTNLEGNVLVPALIAKGALNATFAAADLELLFATDGVWEQIPLAGNVPTWGDKATPLGGLGVRTGRRIYPGAEGILGKWHYPALLGTTPGAGGTPVDLSGLTEKIDALDKQADDYQAHLLAAIGGVDEATLATFGLKRA